MTTTILFSGGVDSTLMAHYAATQNLEPRLLYFNIGQPYAAKELAALPATVEVFKVDWITNSSQIVDKLDSHCGNTYIPGRNLNFITLAASITQPQHIWLGAVLGEIHAKATDKNLKFLQDTQKLLSYVHQRPISLHYPLVSMQWGKVEAITWALEHGLSPHQLESTMSCLTAEDGHCGACIACFRRWGVFKQLGLHTTFNRNPLQVANNQAIIYAMYTTDHYDSFRCNEILPALDMI